MVLLCWPIFTSIHTKWTNKQSCIGVSAMVSAIEGSTVHTKWTNKQGCIGVSTMVSTIEGSTVHEYRGGREMYTE